MDENTPKFPKDSDPSTNYAYNGKVMLISVIVLFVFCIIFAGFHFYSRWFLVRRSRNLRHHRRRRFSFASTDATINPSATPKALAPFVLKSLPTFLYSAAHDDPPLECAVCLSEFEDNETGRILPKCNHAFHVECIDMWLLSHSNCPLCRAPIELPHNLGHRCGNPPETIVTVAKSVTSGLRYGDESRMGCSSSSSLPQLQNVSVVIPVVGVDIGPAKRMGGPVPVKTLNRFLSI